MEAAATAAASLSGPDRDMWYWNRENFEGLAQIALWAAEDRRLDSFAEYCRYREHGLRREAFRALESFIGQVLKWSEQEQRDFVDWLCRVQQESPQVHQLIPHPLMDRVVRPVLQRWAASEEQDATPYRWLGLVTGNPSHSRRALAIQKDDDVSRLRLIEHLVGDIEYACHHLPEFFIGSPAQVLEIAEEGARLTAEIQDSHIREAVSVRLNGAAQQVRDWLDFQTARSDDFDQWCAERGRSYSRSRTYWYEGNGP